MNKLLTLFFIYLYLLTTTLNGKEQSLEHIKLQLEWKHQFEFAGFYAAQEKGFYKDIGLNVEFIEYDTKTDITAEVLDNKAQYGVTYASIIAEYISGKPVVLLANFFKQSPLVIVAQKEIQTPAQLKGKTVMGVSNSIDNIILLTMLDKFGVSYDDIKNVPSSFSIDDFVEKKVDAMSVFTTNEIYKLNQKGIKYNIFDPTIYGARYYDINLFTTKKEVEQNPNRAKNFRDASIKGWEYALEHQEEIINLILRKYNTQNKTKEAYLFEAKQIEQLMLPNLYPIGSIDKFRIQSMADIFEQSGLLKDIKTKNLSNFIFQDSNDLLSLTKKEKDFIKDHPKITLGTGDSWAPYVIKNSDGTISGYDNDILTKINQVTGANFIQLTGNWSNMQKLAKDKKIDGLSTLTVTSKRKEFLNFSDVYISLQKMVMVKQRNPLNIKSVEDLVGKTIVIHKGNVADEMAAKQFKNSIIIYADTPKEMLEEVIYGKADATFGNGATEYLLSKLGLPYMENAFALDNSLDLTFAVRKDWGEAISILNKGLSTISKHERIQLKQKWFSHNINSNKQNKINLTLLDKEYLKNKTIKICGNNGFAPVEFKKNNQMQGISIDVMQQLEDILNVKFEYLETKNWADSIKHFKEKKCDILSAAKETKERKEYANFTKPYLNLDLVVITTNDKPFIKNIKQIENKEILMKKKSGKIGFLKSLYPNLNITGKYSIESELFQQISKGDGYGTISTLAVASYMIQRYDLHNLQITGYLDETYDLSIATHKDNLTLLNIMNKALEQISKEKINTIYTKWTSTKVNKIIDYTIVWQVVILSLIIMLLILYWNRRLKKEVDEKTKDLKYINENQKLIINEKTKELQENINTVSKYIIYSKTDLKGIITEVSDAFCNISQYSKDELLGRPHNIIRHPDVSKNLFQSMWQRIESDKVWSGEIKNLKKDGTYYWVQADISPQYDKNGNKVGYVAIRHDITAKKDFEQQHNKLFEAEKIAKEKAQEATKSKSEFLANMSHEIRTPMNGIIGMNHLLLQTSLDNKQRDYLERIDQSSNTLLNIINDILDISKIEAGKLTLDKVDFSMGEVIKYIRNSMEINAKEKNLELNIYHDDKDHICYGDSLRISQVLINLVGNAIKFTHIGKVDLTIEYLETDKVRFFIKDTGIGLSLNQQEKLFKSFSQADNTITRKYGGSGLGLVISKELIELMDGKIWVESELNIGSEFIFEITLEKGTLNNIHHFSTIDNTKKLYKNISMLKESNILLVEDNKINQEIILHLLDNSRINIDLAINGQEAVNKYRANKNKYELILMDLQMPIMDGISATKIIREDNKNIPIIALTANAMKEDIDKTKEAGMNEHLTKPIDVEKLYQMLLKYISHKNDNIAIQNINEKLNTIDIPNFINIDVAEGLKVVMNNNKLYLKILIDFYNTYSKIEFSSLDDEELYRVIHTIRGLSGNIGAILLHKISTKLDNTKDKTYFNEFKDSLQLVLNELEHLDINENKELYKVINISSSKMNELFKSLKVALKTNRPQKLNPIVMEIEKYKLSQKDKELFDKIKQFIERYQFTKALELLLIY